MSSKLPFLNVWYKTHLNLVQEDAPDLTSRQYAVLLSIYLVPPPHTVKNLSERLQVSKPVISRAIKSLSLYGLVQKRTDDSDKRNVIISPTVDGLLWAERMEAKIRKLSVQT